MENLLDPEKFKRIRAVALDKASWLNPADNSIDKDKENGAVSFIVLTKIITGEDEDFIGRIIDSYAITEQKLGNSTYVICNGQRYSLPLKDVVWGRACVIAYFFYHNHPLWKEGGGFEKMVRMIQRNSSVTSEVNRCVTFIDAYYKETQDFKQKISASTCEEEAKISDDNNQIGELQQIIAQKDEEIASLKAQIKELEAGQRIVKTKEAGRPRQILFKSTKIENEQKEKVVALLKEHKLLGKYINCQKEKPINQYLTSIYWRWQETGLVPEKPLLPTAFYHFLHDQCELKFDITQKSFTNFMGKILRHKEKYPEIWMYVRNEFQKQEA